MCSKIITLAVISVLTLAAAARAQELDSILPASIPGYGTPFGVTDVFRPRHQEDMGFVAGGLSVKPALAFNAGYDSAPNEAAGSALFSAAPSLVLADPILGFGAYAEANATIYPGNAPQNISGATLAAGERAVLPGETITLAGGYVRGQETGFTLGGPSFSRPVAFALSNFRAGDEISASLFSIKPEFSITATSFPRFPAENRTEDQESLTITYLQGGPVDLLARLHATQSQGSDPVFNAETNQLLAGLVDTENGLWTLSLLAGAAQRQPRQGAIQTAPVLEARLDWMPSLLDRLRLNVAREIDDPDEIGAAPYTLTEAKLALVHDAPAGFTFNFSAEAEHAAFIQSPARETLFTFDAKAAWQLAPSLAIQSDYRFNDRQSNDLRAANEHILTLGARWTP